MPKVFKDEQCRERDIRETLISILAVADPAYLSKVNLVQFEQGLIDEVHFLVPCDEEEMQQIEHYVPQHGSELYQMARRGAQLL
jgi:hypothetical protein